MINATSGDSVGSRLYLGTLRGSTVDDINPALPIIRNIP